MKVKIVGNILLNIFFLCSSCYAGIEIKLTTMDGASLTQAAVGEPFFLELLVSDTDSTRAPRIDGLERFIVHNAGIQIRSINGNSSVKHMYKLRSDTPGNYIIGPARLSVDGKIVSSDNVQLQVGERQVAQETQAKKKKQTSQAFLRLKINKKEAFVGQKVTAILSFLYSDNSISLEHLSEPEFKDFTIGVKHGPITDVKTVNGTVYQELKWVFEFYPQHSGECVIPACYADFLVQVKRDRFSGFSFLFGPRSVRKRVYSNALRLNVVPLPPHDPPIESIGSFSAFTTKIDPPIAKEGEGMVLSLCIEGEGNLDAISMPVLKDIPAAFKYYDSKSYLLDGNQGKCFEYIVQALEGGDWEIPAQEFTYFDTKQQAYRTLTTAPLHVMIISPHIPNAPKPSNSVNEKNPSDEKKEKDESILAQENIPKQQQNDDLRPLNEEGAWYGINNRSISWFWFFLVIVVSLGYILMHGLRKMWARQNSPHSSTVRKKKAFRTARKQLKAAAGNNSRLYPLFIELFAARQEVSTRSVSQQSIKERLEQAGWPSEEIADWNHFFNIIAEQLYSVQKEYEKKQELFEQAKNWLDKLEKAL